MKLSVVIQAGGESRRMGRNKALIDFQGQPLIEWVIERVRPAADELLITTNHPEEYGFLGLPAFPDVIPGIGALGGLYTAFCCAKYPIVSVIACDMVFVNPTLIQAEKEYLELRGSDGVVPRTETGVETFHSVFRKDVCKRSVRNAIDTGRKRADCWFDDVNMDYFSFEQIARVDPDGLAFFNLNTPEDVYRAELMLQEQVTVR